MLNARNNIAALIVLTGCTSGMTTPPPETGPPESHERLRELTGPGPRTGELIVTPDVLQLRIRRGDRTMPFLNLKRSVYELGCYESAEPRENLVGEDVWWLFMSADEAVALQLTTYGVHAFYWDGDRDCHIRTAALDQLTVTDEVPRQYYKADDAQVAYRWNQNETPFQSFTRLPASAAPGVTGDRAVDFLADVPGEELLVVEPDLISIRAASGDVLLHEEFEIDPDWPCFNAQLNVFDDPAGELYAIATFDTFGTMTDCAQVEGDSRYSMSIADWDADVGRFVPSFRITELLRPLHEGGEDSLVLTTRHDEVAGGRLRVSRHVASRYEQGVELDCLHRDAASGACVSQRECWRWRSSNERRASYALIAPDGVEIDLGMPRAGVRERGEDCDI